jgi:uncharacterized membrane protein YidH (DUF202 family)
MTSIQTTKTTKFLSKSTFVFGIIIGIFGLAICFLGIWLVYLKSTGTTKFSLFGQEFSSNNVGITSIFIGAVVIILSMRRILKTVEKINENHSKTMTNIINSGKSNKIIKK